MNNITIAGKIGKDAVTRHTANDKAVTGFSLADDQGYGDKKTTVWYDCSLWGERGTKLAQYLVKGQSVTVAGTLGTREHEGKTYLTVNVQEVALQGGKKSEGGAPSKADTFEGDDVPF